MAQIGNIPQILTVKKELEALKEAGVLQAWELPYESILTRLSAAIFFLTPTKETKLQEVWKVLANYEKLQYCKNEEKTLSQLAWRVEFNRGLNL